MTLALFVPGEFPKIKFPCNSTTFSSAPMWLVFSNTGSHQFSKGHWKSQQGGVTLFHSIAPFFTDLSNNLYNLNTLRIFCFLLLHEKPITCESLLSTTWRTWLKTCSGIFKHAKKLGFSSGADRDKSQVYAGEFFSFLIKAGMSARETFSALVVDWTLVPQRCPYPYL